MLVESDQLRLVTFWRALLCVVLTLALTSISSAGLGDPVEPHDRDRVSDVGDATSGAWFGRGTPRIVKRVHVDHLALRPWSVPELVEPAPCGCWAAEVDDASPRWSRRHQSASVRGPPRG